MILFINGERVKRIHTEGYIIPVKATDQMLVIEYAGGTWKERAKIVKTGIMSIKNVMNLKWVNFEEIVPLISTKSENHPSVTCLYQMRF